MRAIFNLVFFEPLYNALVWLTDVLPGGEIGLAVIILTILVRVVLFPLQHRMTKTQRRLKELDGEIKAIKEKHSKDSQAQAQALMALYKTHGISPFSGFVLILIQIPILLALYSVFRSGFNFQPELLYSFVPIPETINANFLGLFDLTGRSIALALIAGVAQYFQVRFSMPALPKRDPSAAPNFKDDLTRSMSLQMRFMFPVMIVIFSISLPSAVSLYWITGSLFSIGHELYVKRQSKNLTLSPSATS